MAKKVVDKTEQSLENFDWDSENTFFGVEGSDATVDVVEEVKVELTEEELEEAAKTKPVEKLDADGNVIPEVKKEVPFAEVDEVIEGETEAEKAVRLAALEEEELIETEEVSFTSIIKDGALKFIEVKEDEIFTPERVNELIEENIEKGFEDLMDGMKEDAGEDGLAFMKFITSGGKPNDFLNLWKEAADAPEVDLATVEGQNQMIRFYSENFTELDKKDIDDQLDFFEEGGKKKAYAEKYAEKVKEYYKVKKQELVSNQEKTVKALELKRKETAIIIVDKLQEIEKIGNYSITKDDKKKLGGDITKASVKIGANKFITPVQAKLGEIFRDADPTRLILLAKIVLSDFDTSDVEAKAATKVGRTVKKKIVTGGKRPSSSIPEKKRRLSEFF